MLQHLPEESIAEDYAEDYEVDLHFTVVIMNIFDLFFGPDAYHL